MRIFALTRYARSGASSRVRFMQYAPAFQANGLDLEFVPFFDDCYVEKLRAGRTSVREAMRAYLGRLRRLIGLKQPSAIWMEKEALPWWPWFLERAFLPGSVPLVSDFDDALFHRYDCHSNPCVRALLGRKIDHVMKASAMVFAGNGYLADRARAAGAPRVEIVPTVVDVTRYRPRSHEASPNKPVIGWIGSPSTWAGYMAPMMPMLAELAKAQDARLLAVGAGSGAARVPGLESVDWSEEAEVSLIQSMDIGIMPLTDTPWSRGKCGYKLIQYMACGLPVVASPVGVNCEIVEHGVNGFLASTESEWRQALTTLLADSGLRKQMGEAGRRKVEQHYSLQVWAPRVAALMRSVVDPRG